VAVDETPVPAVPVFGQRPTPLDGRKFRQFGLEVETDSERWVESFDAYLDPDAGAMLQVMNAVTDMQQANATAVLLRTTLRDDDGVSSEWHIPDEVVLDDEGRPVLYVEDEDGEPVEVEVEYDDDDKPINPPAGAEARYEWHDGSLLTAAEAREAIAEFDPLAEGSSRRRFLYVMNSARHRVQLEALTDLAEWITGEATKRPTRRPSSSRRGQQQRGRTSGAGRSGKRG
jgi:hypothetical protein